MLVIPAIDLRCGRAVRLVEGRLDRETVYSDDPPAVARKWEELGAEMIHLVDLDGAFAGSPQNLQTVKDILSSVSIPVELGGGIRTMETVDLLLGLGVSRVILGTAAVRQPEWVAETIKKYGDRIVLGIDSRQGMVAVHGWEDTVEKTDIQLGIEMKELGLTRVIYTDTNRDGTLSGPNFAATGEMAKRTGLKVIASGGVSSLDDIRRLREMETDGVEGVILGKALYAGRLDLREAIMAAREEVF